MRIGVTPRVRERLQVVKLAHPILFALAPVVWLFAINYGEIYPKSIYRSLIVAGLGAILVSLLLGIGTRDWHKGAAIASVSILLFAAYGHIYAYFEPIHVLGIQIGRHRHLIPAFVAGLAIASYLILAKGKDQNRLTGAFFGFGLAIFLVPGLLLVSKAALVSRTSAGSLSDEAGSAIPAGIAYPDIYYIILDGYGRFDVLEKEIGLDSSEFREFLDSRDFYVADQSNTNFMWTAMSLASSLNMTRIQDMGLPLIFGSYPAIFTDPIRNSRVQLELERLGYSTVGFESGYLPTELVDADYYFPSTYSDALGNRSLQGPNTFELVLAGSTGASIIMDFLGSDMYDWFNARDDSQLEVMRTIVLDQFTNLESSVDLPSPKFVFTHIVSPHDPYMFGKNGERINIGQSPNLLADVGIEQPLSTGELYGNQLIYINKRLKDVISIILDESNEPPIIIIQSDHGPGLGKGWSSEGGDRVWTRLAILNAYNLPGECRDVLYPEITPINSFRLILSCYFDLPYPLVADESYFSYWPREFPYGFTEVDVSEAGFLSTEESN